MIVPNAHKVSALDVASLFVRKKSDYTLKDVTGSEDTTTRHVEQDNYRLPPTEFVHLSKRSGQNQTSEVPCWALNN